MDASGTNHFSPDFLPGEGRDVQLISSDGIIFHVHRFLLAHTSPVFRDMFAIGSGSPQITVSEDSKTLGLLLRFFDPTKEPPSLKVKHAIPLLGAAEKYQVPHVLKWWEKEIVLTNGASFDDSEAMDCLALAQRHNIPSVAKLAFRQLEAIASNPRARAREKLQRLTQQQFRELSTDVYDEVVRRETNPGVLFLPAREDYHPKRNQARQKLSTLPRTRLGDLVSDVSSDLERRYPEIKEILGSPPGTADSGYAEFSKPDPPFPSGPTQQHDAGEASEPAQPQSGPVGSSVDGHKGQSTRIAEFRELLRDDILVVSKRNQLPDPTRQETEDFKPPDEIV
ncbi:component of the polarisome [Serendipita sp. 399]|nr:component of the polarisome [Serendipita sp. 399]